MTESPVIDNKWKDFFGSLPESELEAIALLRVIECTNGCIQHAYRENHPKALPLDQTKKAMNYSMALMKEMSFDLGGTKFSFCANTEEHLRVIRGLYTEAFKKNNDDAMEEFMESSVACAAALGKARISSAAVFVERHLPDIFPSGTVSWGENYLYSLLENSKNG